ncbi:hypothetical protein [Crateriforma conspicua]|uniref:Uncharacterized protein n=1 Tax=Crateriforma conspicua TaxID=2527996 RepID=A0A5C6FPR8_9PLAN|nr:hypothetical protein [Crateriforma conspicua]TWU65117.1 hypothetical protein V7x_06630 [Crateriforma conspicua]
MRTFATLAIILLLVTLAVPASADADLDALLGELSFGESQLVSDSAMPSDAEEAIDQLPPPDANVASEQPELGFASDGMIESDQDDLSLTDPIPASGTLVQQQPAYQATPSVELAPQTAIGPAVEQPTALPQPIVSENTAMAGAAHQAGCSCNQCGGHGANMRGQASFAGCSSGQCGSAYQCTPHRKPTLPPPSTFQQVFHSRPANADLWAGYEAEAAHREAHAYKHVRGQCDCFKKKSCFLHRASPPVYRGSCDECQCSSGGCDCSHH